jgi:[acyl-carrier-protein] S-malonyltransferase
VLAATAVHDLQVPVVSNVEAAPNQSGGRVRELLVAQVCAPVRWDESVTAMAGLGVSRFVEIGPGKVLSGLVKRIVKEAELGNCEDLASLNALR